MASHNICIEQYSNNNNETIKPLSGDNTNLLYDVAIGPNRYAKKMFSLENMFTEMEWYSSNGFEPSVLIYLPVIALIGLRVGPFSISTNISNWK